MEHLGTNKLETDRLILRRFALDDAHQMFINWASDELTSRYLSWQAHSHKEETKEILQSWINDYDNVGTYNWAVELKNSKQIIGSIMVVRKKDKFQTCEIGYATEALREVCRYLLKEVGYRLVEARYVSGNPASGRVMKKAGMKKDGVLRHRQIDKNTGEIYDLISYSIIQEELS